jgi:hypothetical protein
VSDLEDEEANGSGLLVILGFVLILYVLRALFSAADQSK